MAATRPQMHSRVRPPRPPCFGACAQIRAVGHRAAQSEIGGGKGVGLTERAHGDVLGGPLADAADLPQTAAHVFAIRRRIEHQRSVAERRRHAADRCGAGARQTDPLETRSSESRGVREEMRDAGRFGFLQGLSESRDEPSGHRGRGAHAHLLPEDGADGELEPIPCSRHAQSRPSANQRFEQRVARQLRCDRPRIGVEVEEPPHPRDDRCDLADERRRHEQQKLRPRPIGGDFDHAASLAGGDAAPIRSGIDRFDTGDGTQREEIAHRLPVVGRPVRKAQREASSSFRHASAAPPERTRRAAVGAADGRVEAAYAAEAGGVGDVDHRQGRFVDQPLRDLDAAGVRDRERSGTEVDVEQPAQLARAHSQSPGEHLDPGRIEDSFLDEP